ncbi:SERTA domain-containing protein 4 [Protopterus annectens]|uniref:SERTA domain-containing protein 4 n=1 Tax=Protopterus annectens TaxID=7888 RepID=UPI001CFB541C|nr:SERTA domain-containing protein 4 [Protopterus annectens]
MTLVLPINRLCDRIAFEGGSQEFPSYQAYWESECFSKSCFSEQTLNKGTLGHSSTDSHYRGILNPIATSRIAYFKRKYVEDEGFHPPLSSCYNKALPAFEERAYVLRMSLEKLKNIEDPEIFLRRSVLINNLMKRIRGDIIMQSGWCISAYTLGGMFPQEWFVPQNCQYGKRSRLSKENSDSLQAYCFYQECSSPYFTMPVSACTSDSHYFPSSSSTPPCSHHHSSPILPSSSQEIDHCLDHTAIYQNKVQISSAETVISNAKSLANHNTTKLNKKKMNKTSWESADVAERYRPCKDEELKLCKGRLSKYPENECNEKSSTNGAWKKHLQRRDCTTADKLCYKKRKQDITKYSVYHGITCNHCSIMICIYYIVLLCHNAYMLALKTGTKVLVHKAVSERHSVYLIL